jgi:hypothetical protein
VDHSLLTEEQHHIPLVYGGCMQLNVLLISIVQSNAAAAVAN